MTARVASRAQERLELWGPRLIVAFTVAALVLVGVDADGPLRQVTTALAVLLAPGLAASLAMGPMSIEARMLITVVASAALLAVVSMVMALLGSSSPVTGLWLSAIVAVALASVPLLRSRREGPPRSHVSAIPENVDLSVETASDMHDDGFDEGGEVR